MPKNLIIMPIAELSEELLTILHEASIILTDLDDVIFTPGNGQERQYFCSSSWFHDRSKYAQDKFGIEKYIELFNHCSNYSSYVPVSQDLNLILSDLAGIKPVLGLTARNIKLADATNKSLLSINMTFSQNINHPSVINGIIYGGHSDIDGLPNHKGKIIDSILDEMNIVAGHVVFMDDNRKNVQQAIESLWDNTHNVTIIHFADVMNRLYCDYHANELAILGELQYLAFINHKLFLPNDEIIGDSCLL